MARNHQKPAQVDISVRRMDFTFTDIPRYWALNDPVCTHFLNALSLTFPDGERFFVDSVRALRDRVEDKVRQKEISGFIGQEAMHSKEHETFNQMLEGQGYGPVIEPALKLTRFLLARARTMLTPKQMLGATAGLEHITAILAQRMLRDPKLIEGLDPSVRALWVWHAIEEIEHKAVAFDLYQDVVGSYWGRVRLLLAGSTGLLGYCVRYTWAFLKADGLHTNPKVLARGLWRLFGWNGIVSGVIPDYLQYFRPGFHPWQEDNSSMIARWKEILPQPSNAAAIAAA